MIFWEYFFPGLLVTRWFKYVTGNRNIASNIQSSSILFIKNRWSESNKPEISVLGQLRRQMLKKTFPRLVTLGETSNLKNGLSRLNLFNIIVVQDSTDTVPILTKKR